ncbi:Nudix family hydrolase [Piscirickettsia litoralis]|uniref:8-oxo-dGTP diphosphatase n=1 Tax=Piscirickettsia litoralis TaxID=1891921 RepID=A0ABX3A211_9GAMM|nr:Nudix family hydrolase [Piscirickettsia litoralis]ODN42911.1 DNA mismatch repair protein MutT [Piscirickettsia litoralis]
MKQVRVAIGVIENKQSQIFTALRPDHVAQGGLWEFPGGKLESNETALSALKRELKEEVGIDVLDAEPLIEVRHDYPEMSVCLYTFRVLEYVGEPTGAEGQKVQWQDKSALLSLNMPKASLPIIKALSLPDRYCITPEGLSDEAVFSYVEKQLVLGINLIQLRGDYSEFITIKLRDLCLKHYARLLIKDLALAKSLGLGVHLRAHELMNCNRQQLIEVNLVAASCHNLAELRKAEQLNADFAVLSPVLPTPSHPAAEGLGWDQFESLVKAVNIAVFALGGMRYEHMNLVKRLGGQGVAGIRLFDECLNFA